MFGRKRHSKPLIMLGHDQELSINLQWERLLAFPPQVQKSKQVNAQRGQSAFQRQLLRRFTPKFQSDGLRYQLGTCHKLSRTVPIHSHFSQITKRQSLNRHSATDVDYYHLRCFRSFSITHSNGSKTAGRNRLK